MEVFNPLSIYKFCCTRVRSHVYQMYLAVCNIRYTFCFLFHITDKLNVLALLHKTFKHDNNPHVLVDQNLRMVYRVRMVVRYRYRQQGWGGGQLPEQPSPQRPASPLAEVTFGTGDTPLTAVDIVPPGIKFMTVLTYVLKILLTKCF